MHPLENGMGVPAFLAKLWRLVEDSGTNNLISWSSDGRSFIIQNQAKFAKELLPLNYKHNNMASFIRQLNMYGFHKITSIDNGGLKFEKDEMEFSHPYFQKGHPYLLEHIKRKIANPKPVEVEKATPKSETVNRVLTEVKNMRGRQESLDTRFGAMKQENEALWREVAILRQKHLKQQQIVNKLIQFLVTIVQPQRSGLSSGIGKRRGQLMINDAPQSKIRKNNEGPIISELTDELLDEVDSDLEDTPMNFTNVQSPGSQSSKGSSSLDQEYLPSLPTLTPESLANFITNNYTPDNYYVADQDGASNSAGSVDGYGFDDIDVIDTNNMAIYSGGAIKKDSRSSADIYSGSTSQKPETTQAASVKGIGAPAKKEKRTGAVVRSMMKSEPTKQVAIVQDKTQMPQVPANDKSLLLPSNSAGGSTQHAVDTDLMLNVMEQLDQGSTGSSGNDEKLIDAQNSLFDDITQPTNEMMNEGLFVFDGKTGEQEQADDMMVTKYNPKHTHDILRLNSVDDYSSHISNVQSDLDSLKDLLRNDAYDLDTNDLLGTQHAEIPPYMSNSSFDVDTINKLFGNDDIVGYELSPANMSLFDDDKKDENQSELMTYQPSPYNNNLDLNELLQNVDDV